MKMLMFLIGYVLCGLLHGIVLDTTTVTNVDIYIMFISALIVILSPE